MTNPFDAINERLDRIENLVFNLHEKIINQENTKKEEKPKLIKVDEAAKITGYKKGYIYELVFHNAIPYIKRGRSVRFDAEELDAWMRVGRPHILKEVVKSFTK